jgi:LPXTG-motif cell wall-anchored protein
VILTARRRIAVVRDGRSMNAMTQGRARETQGEKMDTTTLLVIVLVVLLLGGGGFFYRRRV